MADKESGYVYILTNPSFREDWVKIGKSSRPVDVRSKELDNTAVPLPFEIFATMKTTKYNEVEKLVHKTIDRILDLGGEVKVEKHEARALCNDPIEYIKEDLKIQEPGVELLRKCMGSVCEDYLTFDILKAYLADKEEDLYWSQGALEMIEKISEQNWLKAQI